MFDRVLERASRANNLTRVPREEERVILRARATVQPRSDPEGNVSAGC